MANARWINGVQLSINKRLRNSNYGNPRYSLFVSDANCRNVQVLNTASDESCNYAVTNYVNANTVVDVHVNGRGTIDDIRERQENGH